MFGVRTVYNLGCRKAKEQEKGGNIMKKTEEISLDLVIEKIKKFEDKESNGEKTLQMIFTDYTDNSDLRKVMTKTIVLDHIYSTRIRYKDIPFVAQNIVNNHKKIDRLLNSGKREYELYEIIAYINVDGVNNAYSFATKYLSFINKELYPIMDSYSRELLKNYREIYPEIPPIKGENNYESFCAAFDAFHKKVNSITKRDFSAKEIDMFIWQYAKDLKQND